MKPKVWPTGGPYRRERVDKKTSIFDKTICLFQNNLDP